MSILTVEEALGAVEEKDLVRHFLNIWPAVEAILRAFSNATELPIFVYLNGVNVYKTSDESMPLFCRKLLNSTYGGVCLHDGWQRAQGKVPEISMGVQLCHAGMMNGRREINTGGLGTLVITYGSRKDGSREAMEYRRLLLEKIAATNPSLAAELRVADEDTVAAEPIESHDQQLMDAIAEIIDRLLRATVGFRSMSINMAHELCNTMLGIGLLTKYFELVSKAGIADPENIEPARLKSAVENFPELFAAAQLGLYVVRNFLSHSSEIQYHRAVSPRFAPVSLSEVTLDVVRLHQRYAHEKGVDFELEKIDSLPVFNGSEMEIRRLLYNVLSNAIKYSYKSVHGAKRTIRVYTRDPYDPGFRQRRFALIVENYGLGVTDEEQPKVFFPGFRGTQAIREVPIGSGIGLSEAQKIMRAHGGAIRLRSKVVHEDQSNRPTYLTRVDLIFPYHSAGSSTERSG